MENLPSEVIVVLVDLMTDGEFSIENIERLDVTAEDRRNLHALFYYQVRILLHKFHQRRAMKLLRSMLSIEQVRELRRCSYFTITGSAGGRYRLYPYSNWSGVVELTERFGKRWFGTVTYCFHEDEDEFCTMPAADRIMGQMLLILADEASFLFQANAKPRYLWNWRLQRRELREAILANRQAA
jgi:hypothetical protein